MKAMFAQSAVPTRFVFDTGGRFSRVVFNHQTESPEVIPGINYALNDKPISEQLLRALRPKLADWLEIANAIYLADRLTKRQINRRAKGLRPWSRRIEISIPVRDWAFWNGIQGILTEILFFLTDDRWTFEFLPGATQRPSEMQDGLFDGVPKHSLIMLYSGGLDSLAGAYLAKKRNPEKHIVLVSAYTNSRIQGAQSRHAAALREHFGGGISHIAVELGLRDFKQGNEMEQSQRTRGFFHVALGSIVGLLCGGDSLWINENGVGALNLPLDASQIGAQNSRPVNPIFLRRMQELGRQITDTVMPLDNPFLFVTKSEMCRQAEAVSHLFADTFSCDFPQRQNKAWHCGTCTSCLLRRASLHAAGFAAIDGETQYLINICGNKMIPESRLSRMEKMENQAWELSLLVDRPDAWQQFAEKFPMLAQISSELTLRGARGSEERFIALLRSWVKDWQSFSGRRRLPMPLLGS
jgi:7-cyano-7-deazaguanine synthase in queuosine biosynthesis